MSVKRSITLVDEKIDDTGNLFFEGHDMGGAPKEIWGEISLRIESKL